MLFVGFGCLLLECANFVSYVHVHKEKSLCVEQNCELMGEMGWGCQCVLPVAKELCPLANSPCFDLRTVVLTPTAVSPAGTEQHGRHSTIDSSLKDWKYY